MQRQRLVRRWRQSLQRSFRQAEDLSGQTEHTFEQYFLKRIDRLKPVRRFVLGWVGLLLLLIAGLVAQNILLGGYYQKVRAVPGGIFSEGLQGTFTNANPIYAVSETDNTVSHLIFAGLFQVNPAGGLSGDLASGYSVDPHGTTYTVKLKPHLRWQDGRALTSRDVVFTYNLIQNPDAQSPLQTSWQGITVTAPDAQTVIFKLPGALASFAYSLTTGIVPEHLLAQVSPSDLRSADFNTLHPVGAGPFGWHAIQATNSDPATAEQQLALVPFAGYQGGKPKLDEFVVHTYSDHNHLLAAFKAKQVTAAYGLPAVPSGLQKDKVVQVHSFLLRAATMTFFKMTNPILSDQKVRTALIQSADVPGIAKRLDYQTTLVREPFLNDQEAYSPAYAEAGFNLNAAQAALQADGWLPGKDGIRTKGNTRLMFGLTAADTPEYRTVTNLLKQQWRAAGADVQVQLQDPADFQTSLSTHSYDALLYGISIGADPDVFVYWDSTQADIRSSQRLNFSEYKNSKADLSLEAGRTRLDPALRAIKYRPFLQAWQQDAPALAMYQPRALYLTNGHVDGLQDGALNEPLDRFFNVQNWQIRQARVTE